VVFIKIINRTCGKIISDNCSLADSFLSRAIGLIFSNDKKKTIFFVFDRIGKNPIHSIFVVYPFFAIYLDKNMKVTEIFKVEPYRWYIGNRKPAKYLLESFDMNIKVNVGDVLECLDGK